MKRGLVYFLIGLVFIIFLVIYIQVSLVFSFDVDYYGKLNYGRLVNDSTRTYQVYGLKLAEDGTGKNFIVLPENAVIRKASDLASSIQYVDAVTYFDIKEDKSIGYVNIFGGIGKDFDIVPGEIYEISITKPMNWSLVLD